MEGQDRFIMRELDDAEVGLGEDREEALADVGSNADLYAASQENTDLINEARVEDAPLRTTPNKHFCYCYCYWYLVLALKNY